LQRRVNPSKAFAIRMEKRARILAIAFVFFKNAVESRFEMKLRVPQVVFYQSLAIRV